MNSFKKLHPLFLLVYFSFIAIFTILLKSPFIKILSLIGAVSYNIVITVDKEKIEAKFYIPLFFLIAITYPIFCHNGATPLFFMNDNAITLESIFYGVNMSINIISLLLWWKAASNTFSSDGVIFLFGNISPSFALFISRTLRFIPVFKKKKKGVNTAQKAMGMYTCDSHFDRVKNYFVMMLSLLCWWIEKAVDTKHAMVSKGYDIKPKTHYSNYKLHIMDIILIICILTASFILAFTKISGQASFWFFPKIKALALTPLTSIMYLLYGTFALLPFVFEKEEDIKWKYYKSKI